jgi:hypothetical protein
MRFAPEAFYSIDGIDSDWIGDQFRQDMESMGIEGGRLAADSTTGRESMPSYPITIVNENGFTDVVRDPETGEPLRWRPDFRETEEYKDLVEAPGKAIESAKLRRERKMSIKASSILREIKQRVNLNFPESKGNPEYFESEEGKIAVRMAVRNMVVMGKADKVDEKEILSGFGIEGVE